MGLEVGVRKREIVILENDGEIGEEDEGWTLGCLT